MTTRGALPALRSPSRETSAGVRRAGFDRNAARRAVRLYLTSRESLARDVAFAMLAGESSNASGDPAGGAADLLVWPPGGAAFAIALVPATGPAPRPVERLADRVAALGGHLYEIRAETPADAVAQLRGLIDRVGRSPEVSVSEDMA